MLTFKKSNNQNNSSKFDWLADNLLGWILVAGAVFGWWAISQTISDLVMPGPIAVGKTLAEGASEIKEASTPFVRQLLTGTQEVTPDAEIGGITTVDALKTVANPGAAALNLGRSIPDSIRKLFSQYRDKDNVVTDEEIKKATDILEKAKRKEQKREQLRNLNNFMLQV